MTPAKSLPIDDCRLLIGRNIPWPGWASGACSAHTKQSASDIDSVAQWLNQSKVQCGYWLRRRFGRGSATDMRRLRESIEARLPLFREIQGMKASSRLSFFPFSS